MKETQEIVELRHIARRVKLRQLLIGFLVVFGSLPLIVTSISVIVQNRTPLENQEKVNLTNRAEAFSRELSDYVATIRDQLRQLGSGLVSIPDGSRISPGLEREWISRYLNTARPHLGFTTRMIDLRDDSVLGPVNLPPVLQDALDQALQDVVDQGTTVYRFVPLSQSRPIAVIAEPVFDDPSSGVPVVVLEGIAELPVERAPQGDVFLIGLDGEVLWTEEANDDLRQAIQASGVVQGHLKLRARAIQVSEYSIPVNGKEQSMIGQLSPMENTGWTVLVQQPKEAAFKVIGTMVKTAVISAAVMVLLAIACAPFATRLISHPIQHLAETSKEIASGNFSRRVEAGGLGMEITDLAENFNLMAGHVQAHVEQLRQAARINRDLFIGSVRAFLTAIEAKEPYTRGHSERVAAYSQIICHHLNLGRDFRERIWIAGLLHDVGKIGIDDRILKKGDRFTDEEFEEMKRHAPIGAEIMSPIEQLKEMLPAIRWHHERWNGKGYPDGLEGEAIPLIARIVAVADTFDAVTTQRVYQDPYTPEDALENIIKRSAGTSFDPRIVSAFVAAYEAGEIRVQEQARARPQNARVSAAVHS